MTCVSRISPPLNGEKESILASVRVVTGDAGAFRDGVVMCPRFHVIEIMTLATRFVDITQENLRVYGRVMVVAVKTGVDGYRTVQIDLVGDQFDVTRKA